MRVFVAAASMLALAACSTTNEPGWTGSGAEPFDAAQQACRDQAGAESGAAFDACMASKGWTRPR